MVMMLMWLKYFNDTSCYVTVMSFPWWNLRWYLYFLGSHSWYSDQIYGWLWMTFWWCIEYIYVSYMLIFIRTRKKYKAWVHNFIIWWWATHFFYVVVIMPSKMHKVHMVQLWCRIPIVLSSHMVEDCCCWWYQEILTNDHELMVF